MKTDPGTMQGPGILFQASWHPGSTQADVGLGRGGSGKRIPPPPLREDPPPHLEEDPLHERVVRERAEHFGQRLTDAAHHWDPGGTLGEGADARVDPAYRQEGDRRRIVVLCNVAADQIVALRQPERVEAARQLGVGLDALGKLVDRRVHVL